MLVEFGLVEQRYKAVCGVATAPPSPTFCQLQRRDLAGRPRRDGGLRRWSGHLHHQGVLIAHRCRARRHDLDKQGSSLGRCCSCRARLQFAQEAGVGGQTEAVFERFTDRARRVLVLAQEEARLLNHDLVGTEHILLGLIREDKGVAAKALEGLGISLEAVREKLEETTGKVGEPTTGPPSFTAGSKCAAVDTGRTTARCSHRWDRAAITSPEADR